jgi:hypothetical protein
MVRRTEVKRNIRKKVMDSNNLRPTRKKIPAAFVSLFTVTRASGNVTRPVERRGARPPARVKSLYCVALAGQMDIFSFQRIS